MAKNINRPGGMDSKNVKNPPLDKPSPKLSNEMAAVRAAASGSVGRLKGVQIKGSNLKELDHK